MPIYEYRCGACETAFEKLVTPGDGPAACPQCGSGDVERKLSAPAAPAQLVKSPGEGRKQERRNAELRKRTKAAFTERRRRARKQRGTGDS